jgi:hypothetical protein
MVVRMMGSGGVWRSLEPGFRFFIGVFGRNSTSVAVKVFSYLIHLILYKFYAFNATCKNTAAIKFSLGHKRLISANFDRFLSLVFYH